MLDALHRKASFRAGAFKRRRRARERSAPHPASRNTAVASASKMTVLHSTSQPAAIIITDLWPPSDSPVCHHTRNCGIDAGKL